MHPSGQQVELRHGDQRAVVVEVGGGLRAYDVTGVPVLDGYAADEMADGARGQVLLPWPNRLPGGRYRWDGQEHVLPLDGPDGRSALHGLARWRSWQPAQTSDGTVTMALRLLPQPGYPFALGLTVGYELDAGGLTVTTSATNLGDRAAPYGCGAHPYLTVGTPLVDDAVLQLPARSLLPDDADHSPADGRSVEATALDFRSARRLGDLALDHTFADLQRDADGRAEVVLSAPETGRRVVLWVDGDYRYLQVFTGDTLPRVDRRRQGLAVEPMSCPPEALRTGTDLLRLEPGDSVSHRWGLRAG